MPFIDIGQIPQISFNYGGRPSAEFLESWGPQTATELSPSGSRRIITYQDPVTHLEVTLRALTYRDYAAVDWVVEFENKGDADTPLLEGILPLDLSTGFLPQERLQVHTAHGSSCQMDDFLPVEVDLLPDQSWTAAPVGGRSSNGALPFINLERKGCGMVLGIGWSGQWMVKANRTQESLRLAAGMQRCSLSLHPGEKIRTPRILLLLWEGSEADTGTNTLRQLLAAHYLPRLNGELVQPPAAQCLQSYFYLTSQAGESFEMTALPKVASLGADAYWIDACWYGGQGEWWEEVGTWEVNQKRFPRGLKVISDAAHQAGMKFVLWFEPERVRPNSRLRQDHPEFLLASDSDPSNFLFNLGNPEARAFMTDLISELIDENGVDIYRQDFNFDPLPFWQAADLPDRVGMTEIRYVEGHYAFWDELLRRHPGMWIDNCASGGRRIDLETLSRSLPLWPSDFSDTIGLRFGMGLHVGDQVINAGLARWLPLFGGGVWNFTPYGTRGQIIGGFTFGLAIDHANFPVDNTAELFHPNDLMARGKTLLDDDFPMEAARLAILEWKSIRQFFLGDFYLLLPLTAYGHDWCAWQLHREDLSAGVALFFRRHQSPFSSMEVSLRSVDPGARYQVSLSKDYQEVTSHIMYGYALSKLVVAIGEKPGSVLLRYSKMA